MHLSQARRDANWNSHSGTACFPSFLAAQIQNPQCKRPCSSDQAAVNAQQHLQRRICNLLPPASRSSFTPQRQRQRPRQKPYRRPLARRGSKLYRVSPLLSVGGRGRELTTIQLGVEVVNRPLFCQQYMGIKRKKGVTFYVYMGLKIQNSSKQTVASTSTLSNTCSNWNRMKSCSVEVKHHLRAIEI